MFLYENPSLYSNWGGQSHSTKTYSFIFYVLGLVGACLYCLGINAVCEVSISFDLCNILFTNRVSRMKERDIIQKLIETSQTASTPKQYIFCSVSAAVQTSEAGNSNRFRGKGSNDRLSSHQRSLSAARSERAGNFQSPLRLAAPLSLHTHHHHHRRRSRHRLAFKDTPLLPAPVFASSSQRSKRDGNIGND